MYMTEYAYPPFATGGSREALRQLALQILDEETPSTIVADDASARLPSLVIRQALRRKSLADGNPPPHHYFLSGHAANTAPIDDFCFPLEGKLLIVTDTIYAGRTILNIMKKLHDAGVPYERQTVASIGTESHGRSNLERAPHPVRLLSGGDSEEFGNTFRNSSLYSGVDTTFGHLHAHRRFESIDAVRQAREEAKSLGNAIFDAWLRDQSEAQA